MFMISSQGTAQKSGPDPVWTVQTSIAFNQTAYQAGKTYRRARSGCAEAKLSARQNPLKDTSSRISSTLITADINACRASQRRV